MQLFLYRGMLNFRKTKEILTLGTLLQKIKLKEHERVCEVSTPNQTKENKIFKTNLIN